MQKGISINWEQKLPNERARKRGVTEIQALPLLMLYSHLGYIHRIISETPSEVC